MRFFARVLGGVVLVALLLAAIGWFAPMALRGPAERAASRALGHPTTVRALHLVPVWPPALVADDVAVRDVGSARQVRARLDGGALWRGEARVTLVTLDRPDLRVDTEAGWPRAPVAPPHAVTAPAPAAPATAGPPPRNWEARVIDGRLVWHDSRVGADVVARASGRITDRAYELRLLVDPPPWFARAGMSAVEVRAQGTPAGAATLGATGIIQGEPFAVAAEVPARAAWSGPVTPSVTARLEVAGAVVALRGELTAAPAFTGHFSTRAADTARLAPLLGLAPTESGPVRVDADVVADRSHVALSGLAFDLPGAAGAGTLAWQAEPMRALRATLGLQRIDLDALPRRVAPVAPVTTPANPRPATPPMVPVLGVADRPLPWARLAGADLDLALSADSLALNGTEIRNAITTVAWHDGVLLAEPIAADVPRGGRVTASVRLDAEAVSHFTLHAPEIAVGPLLRAFDLAPVLDGPAALDVDLHGTGATPRALAATLEGHAALHMAGGTVDDRVLDAVLRAAKLPAPALKGNVTLRCLDFDAQARHGAVSVGSLAVDTDLLRIDGGGTVDLAAETLDLDLRPLLRLGPGLMVPVHVGGTFQKPEPRVGDSGAGGAVPVSAACPQSAPEHVKPPKLLDLLRRLP